MSQPTLAPGQLTQSSPRWDAYTATIRSDPDYELLYLRIRSALSPFGLVTHELRPGRHSYGALHHVTCDGISVCSILVHNAQYPSHVGLEIKGQYTPYVVAVLEADYIDQYTVSRLDSAADFYGLSWDYAENVVKSVALDLDIKCEHVGDYLRAKAGRTIYLGARKSTARIRVYEKSEQMWAKGVSDYPPNVIRCELEYKPAKLQDKEDFVSHDPSSIWGLHGMIREFADRFPIDRGLDCTLRVRAPTTDEKSYRHMTKQYGRVIQHRLATHHNDPFAFVREMMQYTEGVYADDYSVTTFDPNPKHADTANDQPYITFSFSRHGEPLSMTVPDALSLAAGQDYSVPIHSQLHSRPANLTYAQRIDIASHLRDLLNSKDQKKCPIQNHQTQP